MDDDELRSWFTVNMARANAVELVRTAVEHGAFGDPTIELMRGLAVRLAVAMPDTGDRERDRDDWIATMTSRVAELTAIVATVTDIAAATIRAARQHGVNIELG